MSKAIKAKVQLLRDLGFNLTYHQIACLKNCKNEIQLDNVARSIILGEPVFIRR